MQTVVHVLARLNGPWRRWIALVGLIAMVGGGPASAQERAPCEEAIAAGEDAYLNANFEQAINRVSACLDQQDVPEEQAVRAYRLLGLAHLRLNELQQARAAIVNILGLRPEYEADPIQDPPEYVSLVSIVKREVQPEGPPADETPAEDDSPSFFGRTSTWLSILGSIAVGGVVTFLTLGQGSGDGGNGGGGGTGPGQLPPPPGTPPGN